MSHPLFRKTAMEHMSSPDQLDRLIRVTNRRGWLMLSGLGLGISTALIWGILGSIPTRLSGQCIIHKEAGVYTAVAQGGGVISRLEPIKPGDFVRAGQLIATVTQPVIHDQLESARNNLAAVDAELATTIKADEETLRLARQYQKFKVDQIRIGRNAARELAASVEKTLPSQEALQRDGIITMSTLQNNKQQLYSAQQKIQEFDAQERQLVHDYQVQETNSGQKITGIRQRRISALAELQRQETSLNVQSQVLSPLSGEVVEVKVFQGDTISPMTPIMDIEDENTRLSVALYLPPFTEVKNVKLGAEVQVSPYNAKREEFGYIEGRITFMSEHPATREAMLSILHYPSLVDNITRDGQPYMADIEMLPDSSSDNGLKWSSDSGKKVVVTPGTLCNAMVRVTERAPITLVLPWLKKLFGLD